MPLEFRSRQRIAVSQLAAGSLFALVEGFAIVEGAISRDHQHVVSLVFPAISCFQRLCRLSQGPSLRAYRGGIFCWSETRKVRLLRPSSKWLVMK